jgi:hypothetical protein
MKTRRLRWLIVLGAIVALGLGSRRSAPHLPDVVARYGGDTMYAAAMFALVALICPRWTIARIAFVSFIACVIIEISQLYHAPWIDSIRNTRVGGWILGFGFLWSDLICYAAGVGIMVTLTWLASGGLISLRSNH